PVAAPSHLCPLSLCVPPPPPCLPLFPYTTLFRSSSLSVSSLALSSPVVSSVSSVDSSSDVSSPEFVPSVSVSASSPDPVPSLSSDRKSTRLNSSHVSISYAVFCL